MWLDFEKINSNDNLLELRRTYKKDWQLKILQFVELFLGKTKDFHFKTSGSTGYPKEMSFSKENVQLSAQLTGEFFGFNKEKIAILCLSTDYIAGKMMLIRAIYWKMKLLCVKQKSNPLYDITEQIDFMSLVPYQLSEIFDKNENKLKLVKNILIGGGMISHQLKLKIQNSTAKIYESFGMTETLSHFALRRLNGNKPEKHFSVLKGFSITTDKRNCLIINTPFSENAIITNDLIRIVTKNRFEWLGRYDNIINTGGIKFIPEELEKKISHLIAIPYFITSKSDAKLGERIVLVINDKSENINQQKLLGQLTKCLSKYEMPKEIIFKTKFNLSKTGKILREVNN